MFVPQIISTLEHNGAALSAEPGMIKPTEAEMAALRRKSGVDGTSLALRGLRTHKTRSDVDLRKIGRAVDVVSFALNVRLVRLTLALAPSCR